MNRWIILLTVGSLFLSSQQSLFAQNLIVNGGFETGNLTGWTGGNAVEPSGFNNITAHSGNFYLAFGAVGLDSATNQTITTTPGAMYDLEFFYIRDPLGGTPADLNVYWNGGTAIYSEVNSPTHGWVQHDFFVIGTGTDVLSFAGRDDPRWDGVDDVSLTLVGVPEPATLALMGISGTALAGGLYWNRKRRHRRGKQRRASAKIA